MTILVALFLLATLAAFSLFYCYLIPKPIPGIPYNAEATASILGDIPSFSAASSKGVALTDWLLAQTRRHASPLCQVFLTPPFSLRRPPPFVLVADHREAQDVLLRREGFDRSDLTIRLLSLVLPGHHINLKTGPQWQSHRRMLRDLMLPSLLHGFAAPHIYGSALRLMDLWGEKERRAGGRCFDAEGDVFSMALDAVLDFAFGDALSERALPSRVEALKSSPMTLVNEEEEDVVSFNSPPEHPVLESLLRITEAAGEIVASPFPALKWRMMRLRSSERASMRTRDEAVKEQIRQSLWKQSQPDAADTAKSAVDMMLLREGEAAEKEGRAPEYFSRSMLDEILGFIVAGHDTTSTAVSWLLKILADSPSAQTALRSALMTAHAAAASEKRNPTIEEIIKTCVPRLDATIEEGFRYRAAASVAHRQCDQDTVLLGHHFPKGTVFIFFGQGPGITGPSYNADDKVRSPSSIKAAASARPEWDKDDRSQFLPERWLTESGEYDSTAGPVLAFGNGLRGCWGRRLAYLELRILITLIIWNFELHPPAKHLSTYDAVETLTYRPKQFFARLKSTGLSERIVA